MAGEVVLHRYESAAEQPGGDIAISIRLTGSLNPLNRRLKRVVI